MATKRLMALILCVLLALNVLPAGLMTAEEQENQASQGVVAIQQETAPDPGADEVVPKSEPEPEQTAQEEAAAIPPEDQNMELPVDELPAVNPPAAETQPDEGHPEENAAEPERETPATSAGPQKDKKDADEPAVPPAEEPVSPSEEPAVPTIEPAVPADEPAAPQEDESEDLPPETPVTLPADGANSQPDITPENLPDDTAEETPGPAPADNGHREQEPSLTAVVEEVKEPVPAAEPAGLTAMVAASEAPLKTAKPEPTPEPVPQASKALPKVNPQVKSSDGMLMRSASDFDISVTLSRDYVNLSSEPGTAVTWSITPSGGSGDFFYAFDLYKDGVMYAYMASYQYDSTYTFVPSEPGRYAVKAFVYDMSTWREQIEWCWDDLGVSAMWVSAVNCSQSYAYAGDELVWTVETRQATGNLAYYYELYYSSDSYSWTLVDQSSTYQESNTYYHRASQVGYYELDVSVWEKDITYRDVYGSSPVTYVDYGKPTLVVQGIYPNTEYPWIMTDVSWTVDAYGAQGYVQCEFHLYSGETRVESTDWVDGYSWSFFIPRSGSYRVEAFVRDSAFPDLIYQVNSGSLGVSDLYIQSHALNRTAACPGDTVTATTETGGGSGSIYFNHAIYLDGNYLSSEFSESGTFSFVVTQTGTYAVVTDVYDEYVWLSSSTDDLVVVDRPAPAFTAVEASGATAIKASWSAITGATGYELWRSTSSAGVYTRVYTGTARAFNDTGKVSGTPYYYKVRSYKTAGTETYFGLFSAPRVGVALGGPIIASIAAVNGSSLKVTWGAFTGATGYELWRSKTKTGTYTRVYAGTSRAFTNAGLVAGSIWYYKVRAYKTVGTAKYYGVYGAVKFGVPLAAPAAPTAVITSATSATISWKAIPGASGYELLRSSSATGTYTRIYRGTALTFKNLSLRTGSAYYYKVKAYKLVGTVSCYGPLSAYRAVVPK